MTKLVTERPRSYGAASIEVDHIVWCSSCPWWILQRNILFK